MASEASGRVGVSEVAGVCAPLDLEVGKHVAVVDLSDLAARLEMSLERCDDTAG